MQQNTSTDLYANEARKKVSVTNTFTGGNNDREQFFSDQGTEKFGLLFNHYFDSLIHLSFPQLTD